MNNKDVINAINQMVEEHVKKGLITMESINHFSELIANKMGEEMVTELDKWNSSIPEKIKSRDEELKDFKASFNITWKDSLELLEVLIIDCTSFGKELNSTNQKFAKSKTNIRFQAIRRLHGKAILKSWEILELLNNGFPDGAFSLWRSLFEITVIAKLISDSNEEVAERYLNYYIVENYRFVKRYRKYYKKAKLDEISDQEYDVIKKMYETIVDKYGKEYGYFYGWVPKKLISKNKKERVTFEKLKNLVQLEQWSSYYDLASSFLHSSSNSLRYSLAHKDPTKLILVGPSNVGLADPAQSTAICLNIVTQLFYETINKNTNYEESKYLITLSMVVETICHTFVSIQKSLLQ